MDENQENKNLESEKNRKEEVGSNRSPSAQQRQKENDENEDLDYSNLDIEESTGGSAMEEEGNENSRDIDKEEI